VCSASCGLRKSWKRGHGKHPHWGDGQQQDRALPVPEHAFSRGERKQNLGLSRTGREGLQWGHERGRVVAGNKRVAVCLFVDLDFITSWQYQLRGSAVQRGHGTPCAPPGQNMSRVRGAWPAGDTQDGTCMTKHTA